MEIFFGWSVLNMQGFSILITKKTGEKSNHRPLYYTLSDRTTYHVFALKSRAIIELNQVKHKKLIL